MATKKSRLLIEKNGNYKRLIIGGIALDVIEPNNLDDRLKNLMLKPQSSQIIFLRFYDFFKAIINTNYRNCLRNAALVVPVSRSIQTAVARLGFPAVYRYAPFEFVVRVLSVLDSCRGGFYLLGDTAQNLSKVEGNLKSTCPHSQSLGRYIGYFSPEMEKNILMAVSKASPHLLIAGPGLKKEDRWLFWRRNVFKRGVQLYSEECFRYFALLNKRPNRVAFRNGRDFFHEISNNPRKIFAFIPYLFFRAYIFWLRLSTSRVIPHIDTDQ